MNTNELCEYYANLLILQYRGQPKAFAQMKAIASNYNMIQKTVQTVYTALVPTGGSIVFGYLGNPSASIPYNASANAIRDALRTIPGLEAVTVTGDLQTQNMTVTFEGVLSPAALLYVVSSDLWNGDFLAVTITETDVTLPIAVMNGYDLVGANIAAGVQLDVLAKYLGVARNFATEGGTFSLSDSTLLRVIRIAIRKRTMTGSTGDIASFLNEFFPGQALVNNNQDMTITYTVNETLIVSPTWQAMVAFDLIPNPMSVGININSVAPPPGILFGFRDYAAENPSVAPFNQYDPFNTDWTFRTYFTA